MKVLSEVYRFPFHNDGRDRLILHSLAFHLTFGIVRAITISIRAGIGPFHNVSAGGTHIHHVVWGIAILIVVGYVWLLEVGVGSSWIASLTAILFGIGAALTLDEFALWLNLQDVYWERQGRVSVDVVLIFAGLLSVGIWGGPFFNSLIRAVLRLERSVGR